jgi:glycosyltransferase involved in cell wall biosynthesis
MESVFVSFVIPAFNAQKSIVNCIKSIQCQNYENQYYEIIVVDNCSTDSTAKLVKEFKNVTYIYESTKGRSYARNTGARHTSGKLIAFIDADVCLDANWLANLVSCFNNNHVGACQGKIIPSNNDGQESLNKFRIRQQLDSTFNSNIILKLMYVESPMINSAACIYRKEAFNFVEGFDTNLERHEDIDLSKRLSLAGYDLAAKSDAIALVEYHGEGWISYFKRTFREGFTKNAYNEKWGIIFAKLSKEEATNAPSKKSFTKIEKMKLNIYLVIDEIIINIFKSVLYIDFYFLIKAINSIFKSLGRIFGVMYCPYRGVPMVKMNENLLKRKVNSQEDIKLELDDGIRFVYVDNDLSYMINIFTSDFFNLSNFKSLRKILYYIEN